MPGRRRRERPERGSLEAIRRKFIRRSRRAFLGDEAAALEILDAFMAQFGWTGVVFTGGYVQRLLEQRLTELGVTPRELRPIEFRRMQADHTWHGVLPAVLEAAARPALTRVLEDALLQGGTVNWPDDVPADPRCNRREAACDIFGGHGPARPLGEVGPPPYDATVAKWFDMSAIRRALESAGIEPEPGQELVQIFELEQRRAAAGGLCPRCGGPA